MWISVSKSVLQMSLPSRERGLKCCAARSDRVSGASLPSRERGLKYYPAAVQTTGCKSLPSRERGLKCRSLAHNCAGRSSLPSRERGLKWLTRRDRTACHVAPFAGAWIEMHRAESRCKSCGTSLPSRERGLKCRTGAAVCRPAASLPSRERGLKYRDRRGDGHDARRRSLRGSVD